MTTISRLALHRSAEILAPAADVCALLTDWAGMMRWSRGAPSGGPFETLVGCDLVGDAATLPRTRRMRFESGATVAEELFYQNEATRRIHYRKDDTGGTSGYLATSYVDEIDAQSCRLHIGAWFDGPPDQDGAAAAARFETIYGAIFDGFRACLAPVDGQPERPA